MVNSMKSWFKIYLFYGMIFFSLGLVSIFLCKIDLLSDASLKIKKYVDTFRAYTDFEKDFPGQEVPVFNQYKSDKNIHVFLESRQLETNPYILEYVRENLKLSFEKVIVHPIPNSGTVFTSVINMKKSLNTDNLVGLEINNGKPSPTFRDIRYVTILFLAPEIYEKEIGFELGYALQGVNQIIFRRINSASETIYKISWESNQKEEEFRQTIVDVFKVVCDFMNGDSI